MPFLSWMLAKVNLNISFCLPRNRKQEPSRRRGCLGRKHSALRRACPGKMYCLRSGAFLGGIHSLWRASLGRLHRLRRACLGRMHWLWIRRRFADSLRTWLGSRSPEHRRFTLLGRRGCTIWLRRHSWRIHLLGGSNSVHSPIQSFCFPNFLPIVFLSVVKVYDSASWRHCSQFNISPLLVISGWRHNPKSGCRVLRRFWYSSKTSNDKGCGTNQLQGTERIYNAHPRNWSTNQLDSQS